jgi:glucose-6-phosphate 1-dehydrogenase
MQIDHYLGKEIVQNMQVFRFGNTVWEWMWNRNAIENVTFTFKEPYGTDGRGGYFDHYGIIRDILQNHLLQVLTIFAMEPPEADDGDSIRNAKTEVLNHMEPILLENTLLGQYNGYADDPTIQNKDTNCPTYAAIRCFINTPRWKGVPFLLQAGKAMDEQLCEVRVRFKTPPTLRSVQKQAKQLTPNELVLRLQPNPSLELHSNIKTPGLSSTPMPAIMKMNYDDDIPNLSNPDAYTRLLLDVLRGKNGSFVRNDELRRSWEIFTPILHAIERDNVRPFPYDYGSNGPEVRESWFEEMGKFQDDERLVPNAPLQSARL